MTVKYGKFIGALCCEYRKKLGYTQRYVAEEVGYSKESVSAFECGRVNNASILLWYVIHGFNSNNIPYRGEYVK